MTLLAAVLILAPCLAAAVWSLFWIIRWYRKPYGFPWLLSLIFAAAALGAVFALHVLAKF
jgi:hypothetical protein